MKAEQFLEVTDGVETGVTPASEPFIRTAVSRAYYAAHLSAREFYLTRKKISPKHGIVSHRMMIRALKGSELPGLGHQLDQLLDARITADYNLTATVGSSELQIARLIADEILKNLELSAGRPRHR